MSPDALVGGDSWHRAADLSRRVAWPLEPEDLLAETMRRALVARRRFDHNRLVGPWLATIMLNTRIEELIRRRRWRLKVVDLSTCEPAQASRRGDGDPLKHMIDEEDLRVALGVLPGRCRRLIELTADGMSYDEIARRVSIPVGTVRSRLCRARQAVRRALAVPVASL